MKTASHYAVDFFKVPQPVVPAQPAKKAGWGALLNKAWRFLVSSDLEPRVEQKVDRFGHVYWRTYDPFNHQTRFFETETEVCRWLEQRYYQ